MTISKFSMNLFVQQFLPVVSVLDNFCYTYQLCRYDEVIHLCDKTLDSAEKNACPLDAGGEVTDLDNSQLSKGFYFRIWRCSMMLKACFHLGKFEEGLSLLEQQQEKMSAINKYVLLTRDAFTLLCSSSNVKRKEKKRGKSKCEYLRVITLNPLPAGVEARFWIHSYH